MIKILYFVIFELKISANAEDFKRQRKDSSPRFISFNELVRLLREREDKVLASQPSVAMAEEIQTQKQKIKTHAKVSCAF